MPEFSQQNPEVPVESKEITREDAEQLVLAIENAATDLNSLVGLHATEPLTSSDGSRYIFRSDVYHSTEGTRSSRDDNTGSSIIIWKIDPDGYLPKHTHLDLITSRPDSARGSLSVQIYLTEGTTHRLVAEVSCNKKSCTSTESGLVKAKIDQLVTGVLRPRLDEMKAERQRAEEARTQETRQKEQERLERQKERERKPIDDVTNF